MTMWLGTLYILYIISWRKIDWCQWQEKGSRNSSLLPDQEGGLSHSIFNKVEDLLAEVNESQPIQDQYQYQQFSSPGESQEYFYKVMDSNVENTEC